jgi:hypothetical protein
MAARRRVALIAQDPGHAHRFKERLYCGQICRLVTIAVQAARAEEILKAGLRAAPASIAERASSNRPSRANNGGVDEVGPQPPQPRGDSILIRSRHAAETNDVGGKDRCNLPRLGHSASHGRCAGKSDDLHRRDVVYRVREESKMLSGLSTRSV